MNCLNIRWLLAIYVKKESFVNVNCNKTEIIKCGINATPSKMIQRQIGLFHFNMGLII